MLLLLVHDAAFVHDRLTPAAAASWHRRTFAPLAALAAELAPTFDAFAERYRLTADEQPLVRRAGELPFDRRVWRHLVGELLLYAAADVPDVPDARTVLADLLGPDETVRAAYHGRRDLAFAGVRYRPGHASLCDIGDVADLAAALASVNVDAWAADAIRVDPGDDAAEVLADARDAWDQLFDVYESARRAGRVVVCEEVA